MKRRLKTIIKKNRGLFSFLANLKNYKLNKLDRIYENLFSSVIKGSIVVKLKNIPGEFEIDARSHILKRIMIEKKYEPEIVNLILENINVNRDAVNIGANIGLYANLLAENINSKQKVLAIEPTPNAYRLLNANAQRNNNSEKIISFKGILTDKKGDFSINIIQGKEEYSSIGELVHPSIKDEEYSIKTVQGVRLDNLVNEKNIKPGLIIMDVEGAEMNVLQGSVETLKKYHPIIISELDDELLSKQKTSSLEILNFLKKLDYKVTDIEGHSVKFPFQGNIIGR